LHFFLLFFFEKIIPLNGGIQFLQIKRGEIPPNKRE
jgi:hypothetical protein